MTAQHTPGPWEVDLCDNGAFAVYVPPAVDMGWMTVITSRGQLPYRAAESHANARLIAAAPDLLEALQAIVQSWDKNTFDRERFVKSELGDYWTPAAAMVNSETIAAARAVIARATHKEGA